MTVNCAVECVNGCVLSDKCPNLEFKQQASEFIKEKSLDEMLAIAEAAIRKKRTEPPKWILPED
jgi:anti-sigma factor ChrR (cupin superfamily)